MLNQKVNLIFAVDSYKISHWSQFPKGLEYTQYYVESRGGKYNEVMVSGTAKLKNILAQGITVDDVNEANELFQLHFGRDLFNYEGWMIIATELGGKLPLKIRSVKEGLVVPIRNVLLTVENTDPRFGWLPGHFETMILRAIWYPTTVATESFEAKKIIMSFLTKTTDDDVIPLVAPFRLHDFGARGVSSAESARIGGLAHLYNFMGTDTVEALLEARWLYGNTIAGFSIPAREHSTTTIYGEADEDLAFVNSVEQWGDGLYACVMDSYDYEAALERVTTGAFKEKVLAAGGTFVLRPDSGNPVDVVMKAIRTVAKNVGYTVNSKGYKVLHPSYRVIQGDGVDTQEILRILTWLEGQGWSAENVAFGMGGGLLQHMDRDTQKFAMKCSAAIVDGQYRDVFKMPKTDPSKASKKGFLDLIQDTDGEICTVSGTVHNSSPDELSLMETIFEFGEVYGDQTLDGIRALSDEQVKSRMLF